VKEPILVVDDNPANATLLTFLLEAEGYDALSVSDAQQALARLESFEPVLILMDIQLPGMDGLELTRRLKADERWRNVLIVALTA
jgi:CheY-like chemotaxis protein